MLTSKDFDVKRVLICSYKTRNIFLLSLKVIAIYAQLNVLCKDQLDSAHGLMNLTSVKRENVSIKKQNYSNMAMLIISFQFDNKKKTFSGHPLFP